MPAKGGPSKSIVKDVALGELYLDTTYEGREVRVPYPDKNAIPSDPRFLLPLPPINLPNGPQNPQIYYVPADNDRGRSGASKTRVFIPNVPEISLPEDAEGRPERTPQPPSLMFTYGSRIFTIRPLTPQEKYEQEQESQHQTSQQPVLSSPKVFRTTVARAFEDAVDDPSSANIEKILDTLMQSRPGALRSRGITFIYPKEDYMVAHQTDHQIRKLRTSWSLGGAGNFEQFRPALYYKPREEGTKELAWMALVLSRASLKIIPLREEGMPAFTSKDRKLVPLEVCPIFASIHVYVCV
jgi:hypothetical protein